MFFNIAISVVLIAAAALVLRYCTHHSGDASEKNKHSEEKDKWNVDENNEIEEEPGIYRFEEPEGHEDQK